LKPGAIRNAVIEAKTNVASFFDQIERGQILVDGMGCERVAEVMCPSDESEVTVRLAKPDDCVEFFNWANDPAVREQSLSTSTIQWSDHKKWFAEKISSNSCEMYVMEASGLPVGQVRFEKSATVAEINYSLDKIVRNRRWASVMLEIAMRMFGQKSTSTLRARVKSSNVPSSAVFKQLGFSEMPSQDSSLLTFNLEIESEVFGR
jgi:RimJ/RimL family protein N-acetyltransferase